MATVTTAQAGPWEDSATWGGLVPSEDDDAIIFHDVTVSTSHTVAGITFDGGGITVAPSANLPDAGIILAVGSVSFVPSEGHLVRMDGGRIATAPCIVGTYSLVEDHAKIIIDDGGPVGLSAQMMDMTPEGWAPAYARRVSNNVRYQSITIHIRADCLGLVGKLMRMADRPEQVIAITNSAVIKGHIENLAPVTDAGREYLTYRVTIAEGRRWPRWGASSRSSGATSTRSPTASRPSGSASTPRPSPS